MVEATVYDTNIASGGTFTTCATRWLRATTVCDTNRSINNPDPDPKAIKHNQPLGIISPFVSYTVCFYTTTVVSNMCVVNSTA